jgi:hypothetical protein
MLQRERERKSRGERAMRRETNKRDKQFDGKRDREKGANKYT